MAWFKRKEESSGSKVIIAEGLWIKCDSCKEIIYRAEVERGGRVCPKCHYPFRISARERISQLADAGSFEERETGLTTTDPLNFKDTKKYRERVRAAAQKTSTDEAVVCGIASIGGQPAVLAVFEFGFLGGSMGSVVGEKLARAIELAIDKHLPVLHRLGLRRRADAGRHPLADADGQDVGRARAAGRGGAAVHLDPDRSDDRRRHRELRDARRRHHGRAARADRLRRTARHRRDDPPAAAARDFSARSSCWRTGSST